MTVKQQVDKYDNYIPYPEHLKLLVRATDATTSGMKDFSGYGRVITQYGNTTGSTTQKKINPYSMYFDGSGDYLSLSDSDDWNFGSNDFTIVTWVKRSSIGSEGWVLAKLQSGSTNLFRCDFETDNRPLFQIKTDVSTYYVYGTAITDTTSWHQIGMIRSGNTLYAITDGVLSTGVAVSGSIPTESTKVIVGARPDALTTYNYAGYIDELAIWNGVAIPISQLYPQYKPYSFRRA